jgi:hypothetical protein
MRSADLIRLGLLLVLAARCGAPLRADPVNPVLLAQRWPASWITSPGASATEFGVYHFRRTFSLAAVPAHLVIHVSADNRFRLFLNGQPVASGPAQDDLLDWRFETVDLAPGLRPGRNVLAAVVWNGGLARPMAQISHRTGFIVQADDLAQGADVDTGPAWRVLEDHAYQQIVYRDSDPRLNWNYYVAGATERLEASAYPWGWEQPGFADGAWAAAEAFGPGAPAGVESHQRWQLAPSPVPPLAEHPLRFAAVARSTVAVPAGFPARATGLVVPPRRVVTLLLDQGFLTNGYPILTVSGGRGAQVQLTYAEALLDARHEKGDRDVTAHKVMVGVHDVYLADGGPRRVYRPLWMRAWRYLEVQVTTGREALRIDDLSGVEVESPQPRVAVFESDAPDLNRIWDACWRTLQLCAQDTFITDLSWERLQYVEDVRLQSLARLTTTGDDRLVRRALEQFNQSRVPSGLTLGRYPADLEQFIPLYSLDWIRMVHEFGTWSGDRTVFKRMLPGVRGVLGWYEDQVNADGFVPLLGGLDFCDHFGEVGRTARRSSTDHTLRYLAALEEAADLAGAVGENHDAEVWRTRAQELAERVRRKAYDPAAGFFADGPGLRLYSPLTQCLAIVTNAAPLADQRALLERTLGEASFPPIGLNTRWYLARALKQCGLADRYAATLGPWREMLRNHLSTTTEVLEHPRSDCHPWSAHPAFDLIATVAGIEADAPGFREVRIAPALGDLKHVHARLPTPRGMVEEWLERDGARLHARVALPDGMTGVLVWKGREIPLSGRQELDL